MNKFDSKFKPVKFKRKKVKLREPYYYVPNIQAYIEKIKGDKLPYFQVQFPVDKITNRTKMPLEYFYFYCEDVKGEFKVTYIIFKCDCSSLEAEIDYKKTFKIINKEKK